MAFDFWSTPTGRAMMGLPPMPPPLYQPSYQQFVISEPNNSGGVSFQPVNSQYCVTIDTAYYLAGVYGAKVTYQPFEGAGGPEASNAIEYILNWVDLASGMAYSINAGLLAYYYKPANGLSAEGTVANPDIVVAECRAAIRAALLDALRKQR